MLKEEATGDGASRAYCEESISGPLVWFYTSEKPRTGMGRRLAALKTATEQ